MAVLATGTITFADLNDGAPGPPGTPGYLGLCNIGSTLFLKGYAEDGTLSADVGYIYPSNSDKLPVPAFSEALTGNGQGHVLYNPSWASQVVFAKMEPAPSSISWKNYNTMAAVDVSGNTFVIGSFLRSNNVILNMVVLLPMLVQEFPKAHFLDIMATGNQNDVAMWCSAIGVETLFARIASIEAFIDSVFANDITMSESGIIKSHNFRMESGIPAEGFRLTSLMGLLEAVSAKLYKAEVFGKLIHACCTTREAKTGASISFTASKTRWSSMDLYAMATGAAEDGPPIACSGTVDGVGVVKIARVSVGSDVVVLDAVHSGTTSETVYSYSCTVSGTYRFLFIDFLEDTTWYDRVKYARWKVNGTLIHTGMTSESGLWVEKALVAGDTISVAAKGEHSYVGGSQPITIELKAAFPATRGLLFHNSASVPFSVIPLPEGYYTSAKACAVSSPVSFSSSNLPYASGKTFSDQIAATHAIGETVYASGSVNINGTSKSVSSIIRFASSIRIAFTDGNSGTVVWDEAQGSVSGWYSTLSASYTVLTETEALVTSNLEPREDGSLGIGSSGKYYRNIHLESFVGMVAPFAGSAVPEGFLECDGSAVSRTTYSKLFTKIGTIYGAGNGSTTFNLPDLRGEFIRGFDNGRGVDSGRTFGSFQEDAMRELYGTFGATRAGGYNTPTGVFNLDQGGYTSTTGTGSVGNKYSFSAERYIGSSHISSDIHPRNRALMYCIKY